MENKINQELLEIISKHLPEVEVGAVKKVIVANEDFKNKILTLEEDIKSKDSLLKEYRKRDILFAETIKREESNKIKTEELMKKENELYKKEIELSKNLAEYKVNHLTEVVDKILKNPTVRKNIVGSNTKTGNEGNNYSNINESHNKIEETIEE